MSHIRDKKIDRRLTEWFKVAVLKTAERVSAPWVRIPHLLQYQGIGQWLHKNISGCSAVGRAPALVTVSQSLRNWCTDMIPEDLMSSNLIYPSSRRAWVQIPLPRQKNLVRFDIFRIIAIFITAIY